MSRTPGNGLSLFRLLFVSSCAIGFGLTDAVYFTFILDALQASGASRLTAFLALALGALLSIVLAPLATSFCRDGSSRKRVTLITLSSAALAATATAFLFSQRLSDDFPTANWRIITTILLAAVYRSSIQSSPIVPAVMDAARIVGDEEHFPIRRDLALSGFYLFYRVGFLISAIVIASLPNRVVERVLPILLFASVVSCMTIIVSATIMPEERKESVVDEEAKDSPTNWNKAKSDVKEVLRSSSQLVAVFTETLLYGIAFGQLAAVTAPFYNEVVFKVPPGTANGIKWAAYSALLGWGVGILSDTILPLIVFREKSSKKMMSIVWFVSSMLGFGLFFALFFTEDKNRALVLFGFLAITTATHNQFSLIAAGALVEPRLRSTAFGCRAASLHIGLLIGSITGGVISQITSFRGVMLLSAVATAASGFVTLAIGHVKKTQYDGVAANANPLASFIVIGIEGGQ